MRKLSERSGKNSQKSCSSQRNAGEHKPEQPHVRGVTQHRPRVQGNRAWSHIKGSVIVISPRHIRDPTLAFCSFSGGPLPAADAAAAGSEAVANLALLHTVATTMRRHRAPAEFQSAACGSLMGAISNWSTFCCCCRCASTAGCGWKGLVL